MVALIAGQSRGQTVVAGRSTPAQRIQRDVGSLDRPDYVLFDLDPGKAKFADVVKIAATLHKLLSRRVVDSYVKTSGKTGLHVLYPWKQTGDYDAARAWAMPAR